MAFINPLDLLRERDKWRPDSEKIFLNRFIDGYVYSQLRFTDIAASRANCSSELPKRLEQ